MPIHRTEVRSCSTTHTTTKSLLSYTWIKSSSIPQNEIKSIWTTHTKFKSTSTTQHNSITTQKPSQFQARTKSKWFSTSVQIICQFPPPTQKQITFISTLKSSQGRSPMLRSSHFRPPSQKSSKFPCSHQYKNFLDRIQKQGQIWPPPKNQVNLYPPHKTKLISTPNLNSSNFRSPLQKQVNFACLPTRKSS